MHSPAAFEKYGNEGIGQNPVGTGPFKLIEFVKDRPGHDQRYAVDTTKISAELGWQPQESFEAGMRKTVQWYLENLEWCRRVQDGSYQRERLGLGKEKVL